MRFPVVVAKKILAAYKADRDHRVRITKNWNAGRFDEEALGKPVPDYKGKAFIIRDRYLIIRKTPADEVPEVDGATMFPDKIHTVDLAPGYIPHDLGYAELEEVAADPAWVEAGWTLPSIRALWDAVLGLGILKQASGMSKVGRALVRGLAHAVYGVTRVTGGIAHWVYKVVAPVVVIVVLYSCATGCQRLRIPGVFEFSDEPPEYVVEPYTPEP